MDRNTTARNSAAATYSRHDGSASPSPEPSFDLDELSFDVDGLPEDRSRFEAMSDKDLRRTVQELSEDQADLDELDREELVDLAMELQMASQAGQEEAFLAPSRDYNRHEQSLQDLVTQGFGRLISAGMPVSRFAGSETTIDTEAGEFELRYKATGLGLAMRKQDSDYVVQFDAPMGQAKDTRGAIVELDGRGPAKSLVHSSVELRSRDPLQAQRNLAYAAEVVSGLNEVHRTASKGLVSLALNTYLDSPEAVANRHFLRMPATGLKGNAVEVVALEPQRGIEAVGKLLARDGEHAILAAGAGHSRAMLVVPVKEVSGLDEALVGDHVSISAGEPNKGYYPMPRAVVIDREAALDATRKLAMRVAAAELETAHERHLVVARRLGQPEMEYGDFLRSTLTSQERKERLDRLYVGAMVAQDHRPGLESSTVVRKQLTTERARGSDMQLGR